MGERRITDDVMENVEILAKLTLEPEEREAVVEKLEEILDYVEKLNELDTDGVEPLVYISDQQNVFREDVVTGADGREALMANAPRQKEQQLQVPRTI
ncbi:MAG: Asp-tRNA(Asn)/Glu-tRNA(Gln) amidotransferase subunit GatC [Clostridiales bacterium]|mgnify:FL=1|uniref:Aspartyl/glutamyl-tRNA(Asn/Gln) amidotransferase subunit C n=1 Tax=Candidatus Pullilachnospira stercoravium TaxID=2840913 RepID=A0A9D1NWR7_9FIRM|nr:Asp-tRNA(Asn)/Glu-tRNA(Gln) amidotransferase subunit GatC [Clostridiales bacterium]HIV13972.1 Asp-tRNA(Asn)/Glu-tRNA(Gln) amidotransferase subunit GatC [Candidatus Pullilachnospira stercoravium]